MELYQILRHIKNNTPLRILDLNGNILCNVYDKSAIDINLYEYEILYISIMIRKHTQMNLATYA